MAENQEEKFITEVINRIKSRADEQNISLAKLSKTIGMTTAGFYKMLKQGSLQVVTLKKLSEALNISCAELLGEHINNAEGRAVVLMRELFKEIGNESK